MDLLVMYIMNFGENIKYFVSKPFVRITESLSQISTQVIEPHL